MIMGFIAELRSKGYAVESVCRVLREQGCQVAARTFRAWQHRPAAARTITDARVVDAVRAAAWRVDEHGKRHLTPEGLYGRRKMTAHLRRTVDEAITPGSVDRAMRLLGLRGVRRSKKVRTTIPAAGGTRAPDLLDRDFTASRPDEKWVTDFTYVRTWAGFVYVAFILDVFSRRIVGWHVASNKRPELVTTPLRMALWERARQGHPVTAGTLVHHSDAGSQYTSIKLTERLALEEVTASIGSVGDAYDNAMMESANGLYKTECIGTTVFHAGSYKSITDVEFATAAWVEWYNNSRLHGSIGLIPPIEAEAAYYAALNRELHPV